jgi:hypothetical protein
MHFRYSKIMALNAYLIGRLNSKFIRHTFFVLLRCRFPIDCSGSRNSHLNEWAALGSGAAPFRKKQKKHPKVLFSS